jgi:hypothetical protein
MKNGTSSPELSIFWQVEHPAKRLAALASEADFLTIVATWPLSISELLHACSLAGSSGRMSWDYCTQTEAGILEPSLEHYETAAISSATECWTLAISESPSPEDESFSWRSVETVLETGDIPQRFYATPKACAGFLRRDIRRGMKLLDALREGVSRVAATWPQKKDS